MVKTGKITFQGEVGAYSDLACRTFQPDFEPVACATFEKAMAAVGEGQAELALLPVENSLAGRVSDIHVLLPQSDLHITGEYFMPIHHQLMARPGVCLDDIKTVRSHAMALGQCRRLFTDYPFKPEASGDTAGAARTLAEQGQTDVGVIASVMAAETYGLTILKKDIEDRGHNTTRFLLMAREPGDVTADDGTIVTSFVFQVRNIPSALYKALGGFATNGVNMTKLESYQLEGSFTATMFYADIEGHPDERAVQLALEELGFFSSSLKILGIYPSARQRGALP
ncbi:MAG: prephenate dehydratase [Pseudomonadota bacterium]